jgi:hypothetical protein
MEKTIAEAAKKSLSHINKCSNTFVVDQWVKLTYTFGIETLKDVMSWRNGGTSWPKNH